MVFCNHRAHLHAHFDLLSSSPLIFLVMEHMYLNSWFCLDVVALQWPVVTKDRYMYGMCLVLVPIAYMYFVRSRLP